MTAARWVAIVGACGAMTAACAPASPSGVNVAAADAPPIAAVHASQCSRCHSAPEPGTVTRAELEEAFGRHKKRVKLSTEEWQAMVEYLAPRVE